MVGTAVMAMVMKSVPWAMGKILSVAIVAVCSTVYLEDDGTQCNKKANTHASKKHQCCPLRLLYKRGRISEQIN